MRVEEYGFKHSPPLFFQADGRVEFPVEVELADESGTKVARMSVDWHVRKNA